MRTKQPYVQIDPDVLERIRQIDLLSYLREFEPSNLVKVKGTSNVYCTAEHDSLKISNGKWYWWSRGGRLFCPRLSHQGKGILLCRSCGNSHGADDGGLEATLCSQER